MFRRQVLLDLALSPVAGSLATTAMEPVSMKLYGPEPPADRARVDDVRPDPPYPIAAEKTATALGITLTGSQRDNASLGYHCGLSISWASLGQQVNHGK